MPTAPSIQEFDIPTANSQPADIATGPDGALWFTERASARIGRITTAGQVTEFPLTAGSQPDGITLGPDGKLWFTEAGSSKIGRITKRGRIKEFPTPTYGSAPTRITAGPDGNLWFTESLGSKIGRVTTAGDITEFFTHVPSTNPEDITVGPDGALWFTMFPDPEGMVPGWVGRITTDAQITLFPTQGKDEDVVSPLGIASGPDGNLWITGPGNGTIGRVTTAGTVTAFDLPDGVASSPAFITARGKALWFTEAGLGAGRPRLGPDGGLGAAGLTELGNKIARITTDGTIHELDVPTPGSSPTGIALGPSRQIWFTEMAANQIGEVMF